MNAHVFHDGESSISLELKHSAKDTPADLDALERLLALSQVEAEFTGQFSVHDGHVVIQLDLSKARLPGGV
ncbi:MAG: hypothetical protein KGI71_05095 [Patescibacteria group bacterium]|nr:hypothetical protein [Patescibacteria group bacterium]